MNPSLPANGREAEGRPRMRRRVLWLTGVAGVALTCAALIWWGRRHQATGVVESLQLPTPANLEALSPQLRAYLAERSLAVHEKPQDVPRHVDLGMAYAVNGLWKEAKQAFENVALLRPHEPLAHLYVGIASAELGQTEEALRRFRELTERFPSFPQGFYRWGEIALRQGALDEAESAFGRLTELVPTEWRGPAGAGEVLLRRGKFSEAEQALRRAVVLDAEAWHAHYLLGSALRQLGRTEEAELHLALGAGRMNYPMRDPWNIDAPRHMKLIPDQIELAQGWCAAGQPDRAVGLLQEALRYQPTNTPLINNLAIALNQAGQPDQARLLLLRILESEPSNVPACIALSFSYLELGLTNEALQWASQAVAFGTNLAQAHLARANALLGMERDSEAVTALESAAACDPQNVEILLELGDVCWRNMENGPRALEYYTRAARMNPAFTATYLRLAEFHLTRGELDSARQAIETLGKIAPNHPAVPELRKAAAAVPGAG